MRLLLAAFLLWSLSGCASLGHGPSATDHGVDGVACVGSLPAQPQQLLADCCNRTLLERAQLPSGKGGVCAAKVYTVTEPVRLYRVFDSSKPYTKYGSWWAMKPPSGSRSDYQAAYAICPEWSKLDRAVSCEVRAGTQLVIGNTQSAQCEDGSSYPKTAEIQVYVPNDGKAGIIHVGNCGAETKWP